MSIRVAALLAALCALLPAHGAIAQSSDKWPVRPIRLVVVSAAGSGSDILARATAERLAAALKQPMIVDNRPGATGMIATRAVLGAAPDGYTLLYSNASSTVMLAALDPNLGVDFSKDLTPVAVTAVGGVLMMASPQLPAGNLAEVVALVKAAPDRYSYGSWGVGSNGHLTMEWLKTKTGMKIGHVPYKSVPTLLTELSAGLINIGWSDPVSPLPFITSGRVKAIAVNGPVRTPKLPDLPTMGEQGHAFPAVGWQGIFAPAGTPLAIIDRIHAEADRIQREPELKALMNRHNVEAPPLWTTEQFRALLTNELEVWRKIVQDGNIKME